MTRMIARLRATDRANGFKSYYSPVTSHGRRNFVGPVGGSGVASPRPETTESRETPPAFEDRRRTVIAPERFDIQCRAFSGPPIAGRRESALDGSLAPLNATGMRRDSGCRRASSPMGRTAKA